MADKSLEQIAQEVTDSINAEEKAFNESEAQSNEVEHVQELEQEAPKQQMKPRQSGRENLIAEKNRHLREKRESDAAAQILAQQNAQLQDALEQQASIEYALRQQNLKLKEEFASVYLAGAIQENDTGTQTMLHQSLAKLAAEKAMLERDAENRRARYTDYSEPIENQYNQPPVNEDFESWRLDNSWFDSSPLLREEAINISNLLAAQYQREGRGQEVGGLSFMNDVGNRVHSNHGLGSKVNSPVRRPAAPVSRQASGVVANTQYGNKVILSAEENAMADALPMYKSDGRTPLSSAEKRIIYAQNK